MVIRSISSQIFVNRQREIGLVEDRADTLRYGGTVFPAVVCFYGVVGIGKTALVSQLYDRLRNKGITVARIDFIRTDRYKSPDEGRITLLEDLLVDLASQAEIKPQEFPQEVSRFWEVTREQRDEAGSLPGDERSHLIREEQIDRVAGSFMDYVNKLLAHQKDTPIVLLFDSTEEATQTLAEWIEEKVIGPIIRTDRAVVIVAGRSPVRWKKFEVRRRVYQHKLLPFSLPETQEQIQDYSRLADKIIRLTFGHPFGNVRVIEKVREIEEERKRALSIPEFDRYRPVLVRELVNSLVEEYIMHDVFSELKGAFRVMAILRQFDVDALKVMLSEFLPDFSGKGNAYYLSMVGRMVETTLVEWDSVRRGYSLDISVRRMLALYMQLLDEARYIAVNNAAIRLYEDWIEQISENRSGFVIENLYHRANVLMVKDRKSGLSIAEELQVKLREFLDRYYKKRGEVEVAGANRLLEVLQRDHEFEENIPEGFTMLVETVKDFVNSTR